MGFRSSFTTSSYDVNWPDWFVDKYSGLVNFPKDNNGLLSAMYEAKLYVSWSDLATDIQSVVRVSELNELEFVVMFLHECDGCTRCHITSEHIKWSEPVEWEWVDSSSHDYCYGCSDPPLI